MLDLVIVALFSAAATGMACSWSYLHGRRAGIRIGLAADHCRRIDAAAAASKGHFKQDPLFEAGPHGYDWTGLPVYDPDHPALTADGWLRGVRGITDGVMPTEQPGALESRPPTSPGDQPAGAGPDIHDNPDGGI